MKVKAEKKQDKKKQLMVAVFKRLKSKIESEELIGGIDATFIASS